MLNGTNPIFTVGHSKWSIDEFVEILRYGSVELIVDIRKIPRSRANPQFNSVALTNALSERRIAYRRIEELGGLRTRSNSVSPEVNGFWINASFHNYADYALSNEFRRGLLQLEMLSLERRCAVMCSEALWWRCHRRFVADYLLNDGRAVYHLMSKTRADIAVINPAAKRHGALLRYPAAT
ncbi:DUF488 domain-containing protein [Tardiphaga sp. 862_B3_N1_1]|uniref:DUF488 domain-containing protein n=1 Tax=Tardiphaga sp. 862_B3_N1_1 TaxID=3240763 RepID=UPI003F8A00DE